MASASLSILQDTMDTRTPLGDYLLKLSSSLLLPRFLFLLLFILPFDPFCGEESYLFTEAEDTGGYTI